MIITNANVDQHPDLKPSNSYWGTDCVRGHGLKSRDNKQNNLRYKAGRNCIQCQSIASRASKQNKNRNLSALKKKEEIDEAKKLETDWWGE